MAFEVVKTEEEQSMINLETETSKKSKRRSKSSNN